MNLDPEEPVTHEEAIPISSSLEVPEVNTVETEPEPSSTDFPSEDKVSLEVEERDALLSPENPEAVNVEFNDDSISLAAAEPGPDVVEAVETPVLETSESQTRHSVEETTGVSFIHILSAGSLVNSNKIIKEVHIAEAASESESIVPNEGQLPSAMEVLPSNSELESTVEPVKVQLEILETRENDRNAEVESQIIPAVVEESPAQIEEGKPVLAAIQVRQLLSSSSYLLTVNQ